MTNDEEQDDQIDGGATPIRGILKGGFDTRRILRRTPELLKRLLKTRSL
jgi:hypothetical protein